MEFEWVQIGSTNLWHQNLTLEFWHHTLIFDFLCQNPFFAQVLFCKFHLEFTSTIDRPEACTAKTLAKTLHLLSMGRWYLNVDRGAESLAASIIRTVFNILISIYLPSLLQSRFLSCRCRMHLRSLVHIYITSKARFTISLNLSVNFFHEKSLS